MFRPMNSSEAGKYCPHITFLHTCHYPMRSAYTFCCDLVCCGYYRHGLVDYMIYLPIVVKRFNHMILILWNPKLFPVGMCRLLQLFGWYVTSHNDLSCAKDKQLMYLFQPCHLWDLIQLSATRSLYWPLLTVPEQFIFYIFYFKSFTV